MESIHGEQPQLSARPLDSSTEFAAHLAQAVDRLVRHPYAAQIRW
jgi:hypothetical protein